MTKLIALAVFTGSLLLSQAPNISGVWRADLQKSKRTGPPVITYLVIIEQKSAVFNNRTKEEAPQVTDTTGTWGQRGEQRAVLSFFTNGKPKVGSYQGVPTELTGTAEGNKITVKAEVAGLPDNFKRTYELSPDGKTLTMDEEGVSGGHPIKNTIVLVKQAEAEGEPLRKAEELAGVHFKNVKTDSLKNMPASEFIDSMHYFAWALGKNCEFCHVQRKFDADDKKQKVTARKMIDMTAAINEHNFEGKPAVRCFTCHEAQGHPLSHQLFADEIEAERARAAKEAAEREANRPPGPGPGPGPGGPPPQL
jgi:hypothetical protein